MLLVAFSLTIALVFVAKTGTPKGPKGEEIGLSVERHNGWEIFARRCQSFSDGNAAKFFTMLFLPKYQNFLMQ